MIQRLSPISHRAVSFVSLNRVCVRYISHRKEPIQFPEYNVKTYGADVKKFSQLPTNFGANQHISIDDALKEKLRSILWKFNAPIRYAFAYGSGVFQQANADANNVRSPCTSYHFFGELMIETDGGLYFRSITYATLARTELGATSKSLQFDEASWERRN